jgi:hypothetical protein
LELHKEYCLQENSSFNGTNGKKLDTHRKFFQIRIERAGGVEAVCRGEDVATTYNGSTTQLLPIQLHLYLQYIQAIQLFWEKNMYG